MPARIIPNLAGIEKYVSGFAPLLRKQHYKHFKTAVLGIIDGDDSVADLARKSGTPERTMYHFFNDAWFDDTALLKKSVQVMNNHTETRTTKESLLILDFTSNFKKGDKFEWIDWLWNEETDKTDGKGYESLLALEVHPVKKYRKWLGMRRYYHDDVLYETEYTRDDFEKRPVCTSRLLKQIRLLTKAEELVVDGEFIDAFLVHRCEQLKLAWTGRIRRSLLVTYEGGDKQLHEMAQELLKSGKYRWQKVKYRNQTIEAFVFTGRLPSLKDRRVRIAVCKNKKGQLAFLATSVLKRNVNEICQIYGLRWEIEVFIRDTKQNLSFGDYRMRIVGANSRWEIFTLIAANLVELVRKTKIEKVTQSARFSWFTQAIKRMYSTVKP